MLPNGPEGTRVILGLAVLLALPALAGCIGSETTGDTATTPHPEDDAALLFDDPVAVSRDQPGSEPVVDVASDGTLFLQGIGTERYGSTGQEGPANNVWRSTDGGATWEDVTPLSESRLGADSFVLVGPGDTVYVANDVLGSHLSIWRSTDLGDSWERSAHLPLPGPVHRMWMDAGPSGEVHVVVFSLPVVDVLLGVLDVDGDAGGTHLGAWHTSSADQGRTWSAPTQVSPEMEFGTDLAIGPDGTLYIVSLEPPPDGEWDAQNEGDWRLYRSADAGDTWETVDLWSVETVLESSFQSLAIDEEGTLYFHWAEQRNGTARILHSASTDGGDTWTEPTVLLDTGASRTLPWAETRAPGELSLIWYGADTPGIPAEHDTDWHLDHAVVTRADTGQPEVHVTRLTPDPVHTGTLCNDGPGCGEGENRDLLDFPWVAIGPEGRAHVAAASTNWDLPSAFPVYVGEADGAARAIASSHQAR